MDQTWLFAATSTFQNILCLNSANSTRVASRCLHLSPSFDGRLSLGVLAEEKRKVGVTCPNKSSLQLSAEPYFYYQLPLVPYQLCSSFSKANLHQTNCQIFGFRKIQWALLPNNYTNTITEGENLDSSFVIENKTRMLTATVTVYQ